MEPSTKLFYELTMFPGFMTVVYIFGAQHLRGTGNIISESRGCLERAGATDLILAALMTLMFDEYFRFTKHRSDIILSDFEGAEIANGAGTLGFFSASSIWSFVMTTGILLMSYGIAFMAYWLIVLGAVTLIAAGTKLNTQYTTPPEKHQSEYN